MAKVLLNVDDDVKELWVEAATGEQLTLSEWIRRACQAALDGRGKGMVSGEIPERIEAASLLIPKHPPRPSSADKGFTPDFKTPAAPKQKRR